MHCISKNAFGRNTLEVLSSDRKGTYAVTVTGNWRNPLSGTVFDSGSDTIIQSQQIQYHPPSHNKASRRFTFMIAHHVRLTCEALRDTVAHD
jgi:hypothetical protein